MSEIRVSQVENGYIVQETNALTRTMVFATLDEVMQEMLTEFEGRYAGMGGDSFGRVTIDRGGAAELLRQLRESQARIAVLEEAVTEALAQATGEWDQMQRHPASRFAGDVAYYESVLHPESQAREMLGEDKP